MLPTKLNPLGINPYDGYMKFEKVGNLWDREQEVIIDTANDVQIPEGIGISGLFQWKISIHGVYTLSADITLYEDDTTTSPKITMYINYRDGSRSVASVNITNADNNPHRYSVSCASNARKELDSIQFLLFNSSSSYGVHHVKAENIMLSLHGETEYTPYIPNIYRCYGRSTQNQGRNLIALPDYELVYNSTDGLATAHWTIKNNRIKLISDYRQASGKYECTLKLSNGYKPQFMGSSARQEYFLPPGTYTMSIRNKTSGTDVTGYPSFRAVTTTNKMYQATWSGGDEGYTFTTQDPIAFIHIHAYNYKTDCEFDVQIEEGPVATDWKPYEEISIDNPIPIISNYPKGRYKTNLPGITIKLNDDLRGIYNNEDNTYCQDYVEVDIGTKEKSITRNVKKINTSDDNINFDYYDYIESTSTHQLIFRDTDNKWNENLSSYQSYSDHFKYVEWNYGNNTFYINRRTIDTQLLSFVTDEYLESFDNDGVKKFFANHPTEFIYPLSTPITTLL